MREHIEDVTMGNRGIASGIIRAAVVTAGVLMIPLLGNTYLDGWNWPWQAFVRWGAIVFSFALAYQLAVKGMRNKAYRFAMGLSIATAVILAWANFVLAVGRDDESGAGLAHFIYFGVPVVGFVGAAIARLRARGMAFALVATAIAQMLVPFIAFVFRKTGVAPGAAVPVVGLNGVFIVLFAVSALLFQRAARTHTYR